MTSHVVFEQVIGAHHSKAATDRRETLLRAMPKIERYYAHLHENKRIASDDISPKAREEALALYNKVVADGRYVDLLRTNPAAAADKVGVRSSPEAFRAIDEVASQLRDPGGTVEGPVEAVIAVAVVICCAKPAEGVVIEETAHVRVRL